MTYEETLHYLYTSIPVFQNAGPSAYKPGLGTSIALDDHLGNPHKAYKTIHVAGTNGKGSVSHLLAAILRQSGYKVGLYTSPHLVDFRERIRVNGQKIPEEYVIDFVERHRSFFETLDPSFFELTSSMAFDYFDKRTFNLIQSQTMNWPGTIGIDAMLVNQGEVRNRGFEAQINWNQQVNKDWSYFVSGNFSYLKNWVSDIGVKNTDGTPGVWTGITKNDAYFDGSYRNLPYMYQTAEGEPLASFYLIKTDGIFQSDAEAAAYVNKDGKRIQPDAVAGDLKFVDANGDGVINDEDRQIGRAHV